MNTSVTNPPAWTPVQRFFRMLSLDRKDITYIYVYAIFAGLITLSLPLGIQAIISLIAGGTVSTSLIILPGGSGNGFAMHLGIGRNIKKATARTVAC